MRYNYDFSDVTNFKFDEEFVQLQNGIFSLKEIEEGVYADTSPLIRQVNPIFVSEISNVKSTIEGDVTFILYLDDAPYYYNTGWAASDETATQSNTVEELNDDLDNLPAYTSLRLGIFLNSTGIAPASIETFTFNYEPIPTEVPVETAKVFFNVRDIMDRVQELEIGVAVNRRGFVPYKGKVVVVSTPQTVTTQDGYAEFDLIETQNMGVTVYYTFTIAGQRFNKTIPEGAGYINLLDLPDFTG